VLNVVPSTSASRIVNPLMADPRLRKVSFTDSTKVGKMLSRAAENLQRVSMELGGNAPFLVFADADVDAAVEGAMLAKMRNMGEACTAANRFHVHEAVADEFTEKLAGRIGAMKVGRGTEDGVDLGPMIDADGRDKVVELVEDAVGSGAERLVAGGPVDGPGYFYEPTVLTNVPDDARILYEEAFGPVAPIRTFASEDEAIAAANDTEYGLVAYAYIRDLKAALRIVERLEAGMVGLNAGKVSNAAAPFGGVKHSGVGREGGDLGIEEYLETKYVAVSL
jgi:succinate-semialdehyde dehydrogenase/glutarate-semialdehyde dehydrogenase